MTNKLSMSGSWVFDWIFQKAPRRHPGGIHLRFFPLVQAMFGILFCVNHYINLPSGTIFYTFSTQNWSPILQKGVLGTIRGHLQLKAPKKHKTITPGGPQNDTKSQQKVIKNISKIETVFWGSRNTIF